MKWFAFLFITIAAFPIKISAAENLCPNNVYDVSLEYDHHQPAPILLIPDIGEDGMTPQVEWDDLDDFLVKKPLTVHCYLHEHGFEKTDVNIPESVKKCIFDKVNKVFSCE